MHLWVCSTNLTSNWVFRSVAGLKPNITSQSSYFTSKNKVLFQQQHHDWSVSESFKVAIFDMYTEFQHKENSEWALPPAVSVSLPSSLFARTGQGPGAWWWWVSLITTVVMSREHYFQEHLVIQLRSVARPWPSHTRRLCQKPGCQTGTNCIWLCGKSNVYILHKYCNVVAIEIWIVYIHYS